MSTRFAMSMCVMCALVEGVGVGARSLRYAMVVLHRNMESMRVHRLSHCLSVRRSDGLRHVKTYLESTKLRKETKSFCKGALCQYVTFDESRLSAALACLQKAYMKSNSHDNAAFRI